MPSVKLLVDANGAFRPDTPENRALPDSVWGHFTEGGERVGTEPVHKKEPVKAAEKKTKAAPRRKPAPKKLKADGKAS